MPRDDIRMIGWPEYMEAVGHLAAMFPKHAELWGIPRGGALLARMLIYQRRDLGLCEYFDGTPSMLFVVDDIADSGAALYKYHQGYRTAVLYRRATCRVKPDFVAVQLPDGDTSWLVFPYENPELDVPGARQSLDIPEPQPGEPRPPKGCTIRESQDRPDKEG